MRLRGIPRRALALLGGAVLIAGLTAPADAATSGAIDTASLRTLLDDVHTAGMPGIYTQVRDGRSTWAAASGVADVGTNRPVHPYMEHRVGSVTKAFTSVALMQQVQAGRLALDDPIGRYLPDLVPGDRGQAITVRMLLNHTSGIGDYVMSAFPSLAQPSGADIERYRFRTVDPAQLARWGLAAPPTGAPGETWSYSNTNYVLAGLILQKVTGMPAERYITQNVIRRAGLRHTYFPTSPYIVGPHSRAYENLYGYIDPPEDFSTYDMSWASTAGALVSTMADLETFYRALLTGKLVDRAGLAEMQKTVPESATIQYGLGIYKQTLPCGDFWGHDGAVFGMGTLVLSSPDGKRQIDLGWNLMKYERLDANGQLEPNKIDDALNAYGLAAACGTGENRTTSSGVHLFPLTH